MRLISAGSLVRAQSGPPFIVDCKSLPGAETVFGLDDNDIVFLEHRHMILLEILSKKFSFVELVSHSFAAGLIGKSAHPEKRVVGFHREKRSEDFHPQFLMLR